MKETFDFSYQLNIEEYQPNVTTATIAAFPAACFVV